MIGTSGLLNIDTGDGYATGFDTQTFGHRERASGGSGGTFNIDEFMHGYTDQRRRHAGDSGTYLIGGMQNRSEGYDEAIDSPAMDTEIININTRSIGDRIMDPLNVRRRFKKNRVASAIAGVVGGVKNMFRGRKLLRRTRL